MNFSYLARCILFLMVMVVSEAALVLVTEEVRDTTEPSEQVAMTADLRTLRARTVVLYGALAIVLFARPVLAAVRKPVSTITPDAP